MKYAHSENSAGVKEPVKLHLQEVSHVASDFAQIWGGQAEAAIAGMFHDIGKYGDLFQEVLARRAVHVDHATPGAAALLDACGVSGLAGAIAIQGHHDGLVTGDYRELKNLLDLSNPVSHDGKKFSEVDLKKMLEQLLEDGFTFSATFESEYPKFYKNNAPIAAMLYVRMLFSALVDADFLATEAHFAHDGKEYRYREPGAELNPARLLEKLIDYVHELGTRSKADPNVIALRNDLFNCCLTAAESPTGIFTLTAPTGAGKTLAMLAFALKHCQKHNLRRIILVLPFLNIIDQTAQTVERIFDGLSEKPLVLQDHSLAESPEGDMARLLAENWDAPIIITTTVKFFEGLFANKSTVCRRLHNIAHSVVIFDEAQTMPQDLAIPTLAALSALSENFGCTTVFSTATQPAFRSLDAKVCEYSPKGWNPREIVPDSLHLFERARRVKVEWPNEEQTWEEISEEAADYPQILVITNLRRHALTLFERIEPFKPSEIFHLSTNMCSAHRLEVLEEVKRRLQEKEPCTLISTQCVEAGVDLDFPTVFRAIGPLEAIAQAAGRCNREGKLKEGYLKIFMPRVDGREYPTDDYARAAIELKLMLRESGPLDIYDPATIFRYYERYFAAGGSNKGDLDDAIRRYHFQDTAYYYRWIKRYGAEVLVPYRPRYDEIHDLIAEARERGINASWIRQARPYSVNVPINEEIRSSGLLEKVYMRGHKGVKSKEESGWYILLQDDCYSEKTGLNFNRKLEFII